MAVENLNFYRIFFINHVFQINPFCCVLLYNTSISRFSLPQKIYPWRKLGNNLQAVNLVFKTNLVSLCKLQRLQNHAKMIQPIFTHFLLLAHIFFNAQRSVAPNCFSAAVLTYKHFSHDKVFSVVFEQPLSSQANSKSFLWKPKP